MNNLSKEKIQKLVVAELIRVKPDLLDFVFDNAQLTDDLGLESLDIVELVARIEDKFNLPIEDSQIKELSTIERVVNFIYERKAGKVS